MVAGKIGSGKTTLLYAIMEENSKLIGDLQVKGKIAYVEQEPFVFSASVTENICFGLESDQKWFD